MTSAPHSLRYRLGAWKLFISWGCAAGAAVAATSPWIASLQALPLSLRWLLGLAAHWQWAFLAFGVVGVVTALQALHFTAVAASAVIAASWWLHLPAAPGASPSASGRTLAIATSNVHVGNREPQRLIDWILAPGGPDVVVLHEFTAGFSGALALAGGNALRDAYPHRVLHPRPDPFGIAVLSRWPITAQQLVPPDSLLATPKLQLVVDWDGRPVALTAMHPMPPIAPRYAVERDASLLAEAKRLATSGMPGILAGDLNDTPWSSGLRPLAPHLLRASSLAPTWPNAWGWLSALPLDHVLVTKGWAGVHAEVGPDIGSDHRPVLTVLRLDPAPPGR